MYTSICVIFYIHIYTHMCVGVYTLMNQSPNPRTRTYLIPYTPLPISRDNYGLKFPIYHY